MQHFLDQFCDTHYVMMIHKKIYPSFNYKQDFQVYKSKHPSYFWLFSKIKYIKMEIFTFFWQLEMTKKNSIWKIVIFSYAFDEISPIKNGIP
jgi:hypothetical protein